MSVAAATPNDDGLRALLAEGGLEVVVRGTSMEPRIGAGSRLALERCRFVLPGDVVVFRDRDGRLVAHRLLGILPFRDGVRLVTKGDAASGYDDFVRPRDVVGKARLAVPLVQRLGATWEFARFVRRASARRLP